uniref:Uncharacterized protein n=1 Tax=Oryza punctata TaxID=4537 RepID=A0A0E0LE91_ORYPU
MLQAASLPIADDSTLNPNNKQKPSPPDQMPKKKITRSQLVTIIPAEKPIRQINALNKPPKTHSIQIPPKKLETPSHTYTARKTKKRKTAAASSNPRALDLRRPKPSTQNHPHTAIPSSRTPAPPWPPTTLRSPPPRAEQSTARTRSPPSLSPRR